MFLDDVLETAKPGNCHQNPHDQETRNSLRCGGGGGANGTMTADASAPPCGALALFDRHFFIGWARAARPPKERKRSVLHAFEANIMWLDSVEESDNR